MGKFRRLISCFSMLVLVLSLVTVDIYAKPEEGAGDGVAEEKTLDGNANGIDNEKFGELLEPYLGHKASETEKWNYSYIITALKADGMTANAIAGVLGNMRHEAGGCAFAVEGMYTEAAQAACGGHYSNFKVGNTYDYGDYVPLSSGTSSGNGHGLVQWSFTRADDLTAFCDSLPDGIGYVTVIHNEFTGLSSGVYKMATRKIPDVAGQVLFMIAELNGDESASKTAVNKAATAEEAAEIFRANYERGGADSKAERKASAAKVLPAVEYCSGLTGAQGEAGDGSPSEDGMKAVAEELAARGYWSEDQLSSYCKLTEIDIQSLYLDSATREALQQKELEGLVNWERNVRYTAEEDGFIRNLRVASMFLGIFLVVWSILAYAGYWFDRINTIIPLELLNIVSFGRLRISGDEANDVFHIKSKSAKMVNHKNIISICLIAIAFGVLLITGTFYLIVQSFVNLVLRWLGQVG